MINMTFLIADQIKLECASIHLALTSELKPQEEFSWLENLKQIASSAKMGKGYIVYDF